MLSGIVSGIDSYAVNGEYTLAVVIIPYRVKILIPENNLCIDSRIASLQTNRRQFLSRNPKEGDKVIVIIKDFNDRSKRVFGMIVSKWN